MTATEAAKALGVNERTIRRAILDGRIHATKERGVYDISLDSAREAMRRFRQPPVYQAALAEALRLLRAFGHEEDALDVERRFGLTYIAPEPEVYIA